MSRRREAQHNHILPRHICQPCQAYLPTLPRHICQPCQAYLPTLPRHICLEEHEVWLPSPVPI